MKVFYCFLFGSLVTFNVHSQKCQTLDTKSFFTSIKFGGQIPADLTVCSRKTKIENPYYGVLRIGYDSLQRECKKKYADLFTFLSVPFSFSQLGTNKNGQILSVELYSFFNDHSGNAVTYKPPSNFIRINKKLESLYGKPTRIEEPTKTDSLFIKEKGMPLLIAWECNTIHLRLRVIYGARQKALNVLHLQIINRDFDLPEAIQFSE